jgi:uncharacterized membrane protein
MNRLLWVLQIVLGLYFISIGVVHLIQPEGLPANMSWMYELSTPVHVTAGVAEILGGLGLILPGLTKIRPELTVLAAAGLLVMMIAAAVWHAGREETSQIVINVINAGLLGIVAYGRWRVSPLEAT